MFLFRLNQKNNKNYYIKYKSNGKFTQTTCKTTSKKVAKVLFKYFEFGGIIALKYAIEHKLETFDSAIIETLKKKSLNNINSDGSNTPLSLKQLMYKIDSITKDRFVINTFSALIRFYDNNENKLVNEIATEEIDNDDEDVKDFKKFRLSEYKRYSKTETLSPNTVNSEIRYLKIYFKKALKKKWINHNPMEDVKYIPVPKNLFATFDENERRLLIQNCTNELIRNIIYFDFCTASRVSEVCNVMFSDIDFERKTLKITNKEDFLTKNRDIRIIPCNDELINLLLSIDRIEGCPYVFNLNGKKLKPDFITKNFKKEVRKNFGFSDKRHFHNIRHSVLNDFFLNNKNFNPLLIQKWAGHKNLESSLKYSHINVENVRELSNSMKSIAI